VPDGQRRPCGKEATVSATIKLMREGFGIELRRGQFEVSVDGQAVGALEPHGSFETPVNPGHHTLRVQRGRYSSPVRDFEAADGDTVLFRCHGANLWPLWVASLVIPSLAISLRRE
jgi:hypothetical protein